MLEEPGSHDSVSHAWIPLTWVRQDSARLMKGKGKHATMARSIGIKPATPTAVRPEEAAA